MDVKWKNVWRHVALIVDNDRLKVWYYDNGEQFGAQKIRNVQLLYNNSNSNLSALPSLNLSYSGWNRDVESEHGNSFCSPTGTFHPY